MPVRFNLIHKFFFTISGLLLPFVLTEIILRIVFSEQQRLAITSIFEPTNIWASFKNSRAEWIKRFPSNPSEDSLVEINTKFYRVKPSDEKARILILGDSGTLGTGVELDNSYPHRFEFHYHKKSAEKKIEVINSGVYGMTTLDEYRLYLDKLHVLKPKLVVLGIFMANDIGFNLASKRREFAHSNADIKYKFFKLLFNSSVIIQLFSARIFLFNDRYNWLSQLDIGHSYPIPELGLIDEYGLNHISYPENEIATYKIEYSKLTEEAFSVLEEVLRRFKILAENNSSNFLVLLIPSSSAINNDFTMLRYPDILTKLKEKGVLIHVNQLDLNRPYLKLLDICHSLNIACVDPRKELRSHGIKSTIIENDDHLSALGNDILAKKLAEYVLNHDHILLNQ